MSQSHILSSKSVFDKKKYRKLVLKISNPCKVPLLHNDKYYKVLHHSDENYRRPVSGKNYRASVQKNSNQYHLFYLILYVPINIFSDVGTGLPGLNQF